MLLDGKDYIQVDTLGSDLPSQCQNFTQGLMNKLVVVLQETTSIYGTSMERLLLTFVSGYALSFQKELLVLASRY